eukprot:scaffold168024_cov35-Tisochrysis_lutea.AAC.2
MMIARQQMRERRRCCVLSAYVSSRTPRVVDAAAASIFVWMLSICVPCSLTRRARSWKISATSFTCGTRVWVAMIATALTGSSASPRRHGWRPSRGVRIGPA